MLTIHIDYQDYTLSYRILSVNRGVACHWLGKKHTAGNYIVHDNSRSKKYLHSPNKKSTFAL